MVSYVLYVVDVDICVIGVVRYVRCCVGVLGVHSFCFCVDADV